MSMNTLEIIYDVRRKINCLAWRCLLALIIMLILLYQHSAIADEISHPSMLNLNIGQVSIERHTQKPWRYGLEYRMQPIGDYQLIPAIGAFQVNNGANFLYGDLKRDIYLSENIILTPSFGFGVLNESTDFRLGQSLEFRSGIEVSYIAGNNCRIGLALFHMSNGDWQITIPARKILFYLSLYLFRPYCFLAVENPLSPGRLLNI